MIQNLAEAWVALFQKCEKLGVGQLNVVVGDHDVKVAYARTIPDFHIDQKVGYAEDDNDDVDANNDFDDDDDDDDANDDFDNDDDDIDNIAE